MEIKIKRIYEKAAKTDGTRILVDRIWPRGVSKEDAQLDDWIREIAPSTELRKWFNHEDERFNEFSKKYKTELKQHKDLMDSLLEKAKKKKLTLVYSAKNEIHNQAVVLREYLIELK
ncbi:DUF488 family protein [Aequorivita sp. H23M31]|uniref:DUF488 family protein n=1 Tax=Aequorivita ciconiae TaxID=2494375 RepID=A0A410G680_9FLAO|nr:DUF488 family protein [Aequorivita sp. H23M31]QAA82779.1 DUF488 family protein [Aequorivita sp. H23M31]